MKTIYILWLRQIKRYLRSKSRIVGSLGQPLLFLVAFGFGFQSIYAAATGGNYINFLAPGIIGMSILFTAIFGGMEIIWDKQFGFLKETLVAPVPRFTIMLGRTIGGATVAALQGLIVLAMTFVVGFRPESFLAMLLAIVFMFIIALVFSGFAMAIASRLDDMQSFPLIMNFVAMPLFFLSGALFPAGKAGTVLGTVARLNPLSYGVDSLRGLLVGQWEYSLGLDFTVLMVLAAICVGAGAWSFSKIEL